MRRPTVVLPTDSDARGLQRGDVLVVSTAVHPDPGIVDRLFTRGSQAVQGGLTHAAIYVGGGRVVEARLVEGVTKKTLDEAVGDKSFLAFRPRVSKGTRHHAANFAESQVGKPYDGVALARTAAGLVVPDAATWLLDPGKLPRSTQAWTCSNLVAASYARARLTGVARGLTTPVDLRNSDRMEHVKTVARDPAHLVAAYLGRQAGTKTALAPADVHRAADRLGVPWDDDPAFTAACERQTGKAHLDDMDQGELAATIARLRREHGRKEAASGEIPGHILRQAGYPNAAQRVEETGQRVKSVLKGALLHEPAWQPNVLKGRHIFPEKAVHFLADAVSGNPEAMLLASMPGASLTVPSYLAMTRAVARGIGVPSAVRQLAKVAAIVSPLQPQQQRVVDKIMNPNQPGLVVAHGLGSGKSVTALAAQDALGMDADAVMPAALRANWIKEQKKHVVGPGPTTNITSYEMASRGGEHLDKPLLIADEAHRARNPGTGTNAALGSSTAEKRLLLTGSPFYNHPSDIAPLVNLASGERTLPESKTDFSGKYVRDKKVYPGFIDRFFRGVKPGAVAELNPKTRQALGDIVGKWVDYHPSSKENFPEVTRENVDVPMTARQLRMYDAVLGKAPPWVAAKIRSGLPPSKTEAQELNSFMGGVRQVSNTTGAYTREGTRPVDEPKIERAVAELQKTLGENERNKAVVYSNWLESGVTPYEKRLTEAGIPFGEFTGQMGKDERNEMVRKYNAGELRTLLLSSAGGEGLDLKGTRLMQILDPHWNEEKINQVVGRGARYLSHADLPEAERNMRVQNFLATRPRSGVLEKMHLKKPGLAVDQYLTNMAHEKAQLNDQFRALLEERSQQPAAANAPVSTLHKAAAWRIKSNDPMPPRSRKNIAAFVDTLKTWESPHREEAVRLGEQMGNRELFEALHSMRRWYTGQTMAQRLLEHRDQLKGVMKLEPGDALGVFRGFKVPSSDPLAQVRVGQQLTLPVTRNSGFSSWSTTVEPTNRFSGGGNGKVGLIVKLVDTAGVTPVLAPPTHAAPWFNELYNKVIGTSFRPTEGEYLLHAPEVRVEVVRVKGVRKPSVAHEVAKVAEAHPFQGLLRMSGLTKEEREARRRTNAHFKSDDPARWDDFLQHARRKSFVAAVQRDPRSDPRLAQHVDQMNRLLTGKTVGHVRGETGRYRIVQLRGGDALGCTCGDWRYRQSVAPAGQQDCKHIAQWRTEHPAELLDKTAEWRIPVDVVALAAAAAVALGVAGHDLFKSWGLAADQAHVQAKLRADVSGAANVKAYMHERDPSVHVISDVAGVQAMVAQDVPGSHAEKAVIQSFLTTILERGNNAVAYTGRAGAYIIGGGMMHPDIIEHEYGHIQDYREKGIYSGESNPYNRGLLHTLAQTLSRSQYDSGRFAAEQAAWHRAKESPTKAETEAAALGTYDKGFHRRRGVEALRYGVPLALAAATLGLSKAADVTIKNELGDLKAQMREMKAQMRGTAKLELAGLGLLAAHPAYGAFSHAATAVKLPGAPALERFAEHIGASGNKYVHAAEIVGLGALAVPSLRDLMHRSEKTATTHPPDQYLSTEDRAAFRAKTGSEECSLGKDGDGYYARTHRSRSRSYPTVRAIPDGVVKQVGSTG